MFNLKILRKRTVLKWVLEKNLGAGTKIGIHDCSGYLGATFRNEAPRSR